MSERSITLSRRPTPELPKPTRSRRGLFVRAVTLLSRIALARLWKFQPPKQESTVMPNVILLPLTSLLERSLRISSPLPTTVIFLMSVAPTTSSLIYLRMDFLLTENGNTKDDLKLPTDDALIGQMKNGIDEGKDLVVSVMSAMGEEQICTVKDISVCK